MVGGCGVGLVGLVLFVGVGCCGVYDVEVGCIVDGGGV